MAEKTEVDAVASVRSVVNTGDLPDGFKMTDLGPLPMEWRVVRLGEILVETNQRVREIEGQDIVVLSITRHSGLISQEEKFNKRVASQNLDNYKVVKRGELVYGFPMDEGVIHFLWQYPFGAVSPVYYTWKLYNSQAEARFLDYLLKTPCLLRIYEMYQSKTVHRRRIVHPKDFNNIPIPLPPLPEQRAIAHVLRTVQRAKETTDGVIAALKELKKSLMRHLFTYGPVPVEQADQVPLKETELGPLPKEWRVVRLGEVVRLTKGRKPDELIPKYQFGALPYLTADYFRNGLPTEWVPAQYLSRLPFCSKEDVVLIWDGSKAGQVFIGLEGVLASTMVRIDPENQIERDYLYYFLLTQFDLLNSKTTGTTIPHVNKEVFRNLAIPLLPLPEQRAIAEILRTVDRKIEAEESRKQALGALFKTLLHHLMTGKVRVKDFEPAELERTP